MSERARTGVGIVWLLAVLAVLAGCSSLPVDAQDRPTATLTPVSVPEQTPTTDADADERVLAPGLTASGVRDPGRLARAHESTLVGQSFTVGRNTTVEGPNGTLRQWDSRVQVTAGRDRYHSFRIAETSSEYPVSALHPRLEIWFDGSSMYFRGMRDGNVTYARQRGNALGDLSHRDRLYALYASFETRVERVDDGYRVVGTRLASPPVLNAPLLLEAPRNATFVATLTPDGRVRRYRLAYDATFDDRRVRLNRRVRFSRVGATTVSRPAWYGEARNATAPS